MTIRVTDENDEIIYMGDADEFLFENDNDEEIEYLLNSMEYMEDGYTATYYGNQCMEFEIEKLKTELY